jgi:hypothetical protein
MADNANENENTENEGNNNADAAALQAKLADMEKQFNAI